MPRTVQDLKSAGALTEICRYFHACGGRQCDWVQARVFAGREFRSIEPETLDALIDECKKAVSAANCFRGLDRNGKLRPCDIP